MDLALRVFLLLALAGCVLTMYEFFTGDPMHGKGAQLARLIFGDYWRLAMFLNALVITLGVIVFFLWNPLTRWRARSRAAWKRLGSPVRREQGAPMSSVPVGDRPRARSPEEEPVEREVTKEDFKRLYFQYATPDSGWTESYWNNLFEPEKGKRYFFRPPASLEANRMFMSSGDSSHRMFFLTEDSEESFFDFPGKDG